jgi:hypothetical protein
VFLSRHERIGKVIAICRICNVSSIAELVDQYLLHETCPAICCACDYVELHQRTECAGWCPVCTTPTMVSALVLVGL